MINSFIPLLNAAVVITFIITGLRLMWGKTDLKSAGSTFVFGSILCAIANKPILLSQVGTVIINLVQNFGGNINV